MSDVMADFDEMAAGRPAPSIKPTRDKEGKFKEKSARRETKPTKEEPEPKPEETETPEPETKPAEGETPEPEGEVKPVKAAELRTAYEGLKTKVKKELEPEINRLRSQVKELGGKAGDAAPLAEQVKALKARNEVLEHQIEYVEFQESRTFKEKFDNPYNQAWNEAVADFKELSVREPDGVDDSGDPKFKVRPADENDLLALGSMRLSEMDEAANRMFGASASRAIGHIQALKRLNGARLKALEDAKTRAVDWKKQGQAAQAAKRQEMSKFWDEFNSGLKEKYPKAFEPSEGDTDDKAAHTKGFALADLMFRPQSLTPEQIETLPAAFKETLKAGQPLSEKQRVHLAALSRLKIANHDRQVAALKKARARIAELEKDLKAYESSEPSSERAGSTPPATRKDWLEQAGEELAALDRKS